MKIVTPIYRGQCDGSSEIYKPDKGSFGTYEKDFSIYIGHLMPLNYLAIDMFHTDFSGNFIYKETNVKKIKPETLEISFDDGKTWKLVSEFQTN